MNIDVLKELSNLGIDFKAEGYNNTATKFSSISDADKNDISFCYYDEDKAIEFVSLSNAGIILCKNNLIDKVHPKEGQQFIFTDNPRLVFIRLLKAVTKTKSTAKISPYSIISNSNNIGQNCSIGHYTTIDQDSIIGKNCIIGNRVNIKNCIIGNNCIIQSGTTIGEDGFAYERFSNGNLEHFPHVGKVLISDDVHIYTNCSIARGSITDTKIGKGTKIDSMVHIAHNVSIGEYCELTAGTIIGGSTFIGNYTWTGLNSTLKDNICVGNNVIVGAGAMVIKDIDDKDIVAGVPAKSIKDKVNTNQSFLMAGQN
jgi:UDP-3-O-[3-hydroxymyristoyl] glucosamine N-acyltransferase